jgi:hypothetical protein
VFKRVGQTHLDDGTRWADETPETAEAMPVWPCCRGHGGAFAAWGRHIVPTLYGKIVCIPAAVAGIDSIASIGYGYIYSYLDGLQTPEHVRGTSFPLEC